MGNGKPIIYNNWQPGEPSILTVNEDCIEMCNYYGKIKWNDAAWFHQKYFICEE